MKPGGHCQTASRRTKDAWHVPEIGLTGRDRDPPDGDAAAEGEPVALIISDEDGTEHWEGTFDEELAINNGGSTEWTDREGGRHVTEVTPEGTRRTYTSADGQVASESYTPHERQEGTPDTDPSGVDTPWVLWAMSFPVCCRTFRGLGSGADHHDPLYVVPGYGVPVDPVYASPDPGVELIPGIVVTGSPSVAADQGTTRFTRRLLHVANNTHEPITVYVQFHSQVEGGQWSWLPADPATSQEAFAFQLEAGQAGHLDYNGVPISASRVRIWAQSATQQWNTYRDEDLWLVSEVDASGQRAYVATEMETYPFSVE